MTTENHEKLLGSGDPAPVALFNSAADGPFLLIGDHAGIAIPRALGTLGVAREDLDRHIACDIGIRALGERLATLLGAPFIHQSYSRLVIDCNRDPDSPDAIPERSDGTVIPGNRGLSASERARRVNEIHAPYQDAIGRAIAARGQLFALISLHSFTPVMSGERRPWEIGVLHDGSDTAFAARLLAALRGREGIVVGDNQPYRMDATDHTVPRHAYAARIPYAELELRQDLLATEEGVSRWAALLAETIAEARPSFLPPETL